MLFWKNLLCEKFVSMAYSSGPVMYNSPVVFNSDTLTSRQLCTLNSYINNKRIPGWTVNTDNYSVEDLQLFVAYDRELLKQKRAAYNREARKERKHRRRTKTCSVKSSSKSPSTNTAPSLTVKGHPNVVDASFASLGQPTPSPLVPDSIDRDRRDVAYRFSQAVPTIQDSIAVGYQTFFLGGLFNCLIKLLLWQFVLQSYFIQHVVFLLSRN